MAAAALLGLKSGFGVHKAIRHLASRSQVKIVKTSTGRLERADAILSSTGIGKAVYAVAYDSTFPATFPQNGDYYYNLFQQQQFSGDISKLYARSSISWASYPASARKFLLFGGVLESLHNALLAQTPGVASSLVIQPVKELISDKFVNIFCIKPLQE